MNVELSTSGPVSQDRTDDLARRKLLKISAYVVPAIIGKLVISDVASAQASCQPQSCPPASCLPPGCPPLR